MSKRLQPFTVYATVEIQCGIEIKAESLDDAVIASHELRETDFVDVLGDYNDGKLKITGIFENS